MWAAIAGMVFHTASLMVNDGAWREFYRRAAQRLRTLPESAQSAARDELKERVRARLSVFGRSFSRQWHRQYSPRPTAGSRAWRTSPLVNFVGRIEWGSGLCLLAALAFFAPARLGWSGTLACALGSVLGFFTATMAVGARVGTVLAAHAVGAICGALVGYGVLLGIAFGVRKL
jgi:hypothetical protein